MSSMTFGQKLFKPTPPEKGSFPLDHEGLCKQSMIIYMKCLNKNNNQNSLCRLEAKGLYNSLAKMCVQTCYLKSIWTVAWSTTWWCRKSGLNWVSTNRNTLKMVNILVGCTGSVATIKLPILVHSLSEELSKKYSSVKVGLHYLNYCFFHLMWL